jgi:uncharacterized protein (DUF488 family)
VIGENSLVSAPGAEIFTIGHSTMPIDDFLLLLRRQGVRALADVRRYPASRRNPQFDGWTLASALLAAGIDYTQLGDRLGGRRRARPDSPNDGWREEGFRAYADHMGTDDFQVGIERLVQLGAVARAAFMCAEADWRRCHRQLIADAFLARGWRVRHILRGGGIEDHQLTPFAVPVPGRLTYPAPQTSL